MGIYQGHADDPQAVPEFTKAAITAVQHWAYKPYLLNGSPVAVETVITVKFNVQ
jgi:outer membrane biosynthesis protein TonB